MSFCQKPKQKFYGWNKESEAEIKITSLDFTMPGECKPNENEFEYLNPVKIYVDCAPLVLPIYTVVTC